MIKDGFSAYLLFFMLSVLFFTLVLTVHLWQFAVNTIKNIIIRSPHLTAAKKKNPSLKGYMDISALEASGVSILIVGSIFIFMCMIKAFQRRATRSVRSAKTNDPGQVLKEFREVYKGGEGEMPSKECDWTFLLAISMWGICFAWAMVFFLYTQEKIILAWGIGGAGSVIFFLRTLVYMTLNDFKYYENIKNSKNYIK
jgi:hypothetical protein